MFDITKRYGVQSLYRLSRQYACASLQCVYHKGNSRRWVVHVSVEDVKFTSVKVGALVVLAAFVARASGLVAFWGTVRNNTEALLDTTFTTTQLYTTNPAEPTRSTLLHTANTLRIPPINNTARANMADRFPSLDEFNDGAHTQ